MKYFTLTSPALVMFSIFSPTVVCVIPIIMCICSKKISLIFMAVLMDLFMNLIFFVFYHRAFILVTYSQHGIKNKYFDLSFDDIQYATIIDVELLKYSLIPTINIQLICLSTNKKESSFFNYSINDCILLPNTPKVLRRLKECSGDKGREWLSALTNDDKGR